MCSHIRVLGGHDCRLVVLAHAASPVFVRSGGGGWHRSRDNDRYRMSGVRGCRVMGVARPVRLLAGIE